MAKANDKRQHHTLITAEIVFRHKADEAGNVHAIRANGVMASTSKEITAFLIGKAQQIVQMNFHTRMQGEAAEVEILDVVIINLSYLGLMTTEEFKAVPEGAKLQEKPRPQPPANDTEGNPFVSVAPAAVDGPITEGDA